MGQKVGVRQGIGHGHLQVVHYDPNAADESGVKGATHRLDRLALDTGLLGSYIPAFLNDPEVTTTPSRTLAIASVTCRCN
jgi:hypothetical protein